MLVFSSAGSDSLHPALCREKKNCLILSRLCIQTIFVFSNRTCSYGLNAVDFMRTMTLNEFFFLMYVLFVFGFPAVVGYILCVNVVKEKNHVLASLCQELSELFKLYDFS